MKRHTESCRFINISGGRSVDRGEGMMALRFVSRRIPRRPSHFYSLRSQGENEIKVTVPFEKGTRARGMLSRLSAFFS